IVVSADDVHLQERLAGYAALAAAEDAATRLRVKWWQVVDAASATIVARSDCLPYGGQRICSPPEKK
ncbi:MAG: hypothetical protein ACK6EB_46675, partial [Planctomyces sp.]